MNEGNNSTNGSDTKSVNIILAPHPDDEVIGCFSVLNKNLNENIKNNIDYVVYFLTGNDTRHAEAIKCSKHFKFKPIFVTPSTMFDNEELYKLYENDKINTLYIPSIKDRHPLHKQVNKISNTINAEKKVYYTIDKNIDYDVLGRRRIKMKRDILNKIYKSQHKLWAHDEKYILFEGFREHDYETWVYIKTDFIALHMWPDCNIEKVRWLRNQHRHKIYVKVHIRIKEHDREIEFFVLKDKVDTIIERLYGTEKTKELNNKSMEMLCADIRQELMKEYKYKYIDMKISCSEDNEVGAYNV